MTDLIERLEAEILSLRTELTEQARVNGMGAERELKLIAERDEARGEVAAIVAWLRLIGPWEHITPADLATAIEARAYVKENDGG